MNWKTKVEHKFENFSDFIYENRKKTIFTILAIVIALMSQLKNITVDTSTDGFLHESDPLRVEYNLFRDQFGRDEKVMLAIKSDQVFTLSFLKKLQKLHNELESSVPYITEVNSLINARNTRGTIDSLIVDDLFEELPTNVDELKFKEDLARKNPLFKDLLLNEAATFTTIIMDTLTYTTMDKHGNPLKADVDEFGDNTLGSKSSKEDKKIYLRDQENSEIVQTTREIIKKYQSEDFQVLLAGTATINDTIKKSMKSDMQKFVKLVLLIIAIFLFLLFKRLSGVILPLFTVILAIISTISLMAIFSSPITVVTQILPSFLLAITIGASVHLLAIFYKDYDFSKDKKASLQYALGHSGLAIVMTSLTTAAGLWSFSFSELAPVADLGKFASSGILLSLMFTLILLPALIATLNIRPKDIKIDAKSSSQEHTIMDKILLKIAYISVTYPKIIIGISAIIILISIITASQLRFSHKPIIWFTPDHEVRVATETVDRELRGSVTLEIVIDTEKANGLYEPEILNKIEKFSKYLLSIESDKYFVGKTLSVVDIIKETNKALNENRSEFYKIPQNRNMIAQELLLFENSGSDDLEDFVDSQFSKARITAKLPYIDAIDYDTLIKQVELQMHKEFDGVAKVNATGVSNLLARIMNAAIHSSAISYVIAFVLITFMMILLIGNVKIGLISMIPNILPILFMSTVMVIFDMPLDMFTMLIGAIAIGLAVDDTVHFMHNFRKYELIHNDVDKAVSLTLFTTGRAMLVTTIVLTFGFFVFMFASMGNIHNFGLLTGIAIIIAVVADFFLVPALMKVVIKSKKDLD